MSEPSDENPYASAQPTPASPAPGRLRWFFLGGAAITFPILLFSWHVDAFDEPGLKRVTFGYLYWVEFRKLVNPVAPGPDPTGPLPLLIAVSAHLVGSALGGAVVACLAGWKRIFRS